MSLQRVLADLGLPAGPGLEDRLTRLDEGLRGIDAELFLPSGR